MPPVLTPCRALSRAAAVPPAATVSPAGAVPQADATVPWWVSPARVGAPNSVAARSCLRSLARFAPLLLAVALAGCEDPSRERGSFDLVVPVTVQPVVRGSIEKTVASTGTLRPFREAQLATEIRGQLFFEALDGGRRPEQGTWIEAGQVVARLESEEWLITSVRLESRQKAVENAQRNLADREALYDEGLALLSDVETARKQLIDAEADLENGRLQLAKMKVLAPIAGFLTELTDVTESTLVSQGEVIGRVVDYSRVLVDLNIPNSQIGTVGMNQPVRVVNYAFPDRTFEGRITMIDPALDSTTRTFRVQANVENPGLILRPGMFVRAEIVTERHDDVVLVPRELVMTRQNRKVVFVEEGGRAEMREIETGLEDDVAVEVVEGLEAGERLITSNYETLRSRSPVRVSGQTGPGS